MMRSIGALALAATLMIPVAVPAVAQQGRDRDWHGDRGGHYDRDWRGDRGGHYDHDRRGGGGGAAVGGALLGLGIGALIGGAVMSSQPAYRPPPPVYYAPPSPAYNAPPPPPVYYGY
jgi:hypothetical protein